MDAGGLAGQVALFGGAVLTGAGVMVMIGRGVGRLAGGVRRIVHLVDDLAGEPAHGGQPARPGLVERLARIEQELTPNHGTSLRDAVDRLEQGLADHLAEHREASRSESDHV